MSKIIRLGKMSKARACFADEPFSRVTRLLTSKSTSQEEKRNIVDEILGDAHGKHRQVSNPHPFNYDRLYIRHRVEALLSLYPRSIPLYALERCWDVIASGLLSESTPEARGWVHSFDLLFYQDHVPASLLIKQAKWVKENIPEWMHTYGSAIPTPRHLPPQRIFLSGILRCKSVTREVLLVMEKIDSEYIQEKVREHGLYPGNIAPESN